MAIVKPNGKGTLHYVVLQDQFDVAAAQALEYEVHFQFLYNKKEEFQGDVVGAFSSRDEAVTAQQAIQPEGQRLRSAAGQ